MRRLRTTVDNLYFDGDGDGVGAWSWRQGILDHSDVLFDYIRP